jgi:hypothetical protein
VIEKPIERVRRLGPLTRAPIGRSIHHRSSFVFSLGRPRRPEQRPKPTTRAKQPRLDGTDRDLTIAAISSCFKSVDVAKHDEDRSSSGSDASARSMA